MELYAPQYYPRFQCIAERCSHSCCIGWEIDIDEETLARYRALSGALGDQLRAGISVGADGACFSLCPDGRCPMLDERGLCRIITALGEDGLCDICREHPRFYNAVGGHMECGLGAACEAAAALILSEADYTTLVKIGDLPGEEDAVSFDAAQPRAQLLCTLSDGARPLSARLAQIDKDFALPAAICPSAYAALFAGLEYLDERHRRLFLDSRLAAMPQGERAEQYERFFAYLVYRHASAAENMHEFRSAVALSRRLSGLFLALQEQHGLSPIAAAVTISEEIEYSEENTQAIRLAVGV